MELLVLGFVYVVQKIMEPCSAFTFTARKC